MQNAFFRLSFIAAMGLILAACTSPRPVSVATRHLETNQVAQPWLGIHLFVQSDEAVDRLAEELPELAAMGVNSLVIETGYHFDFKSHPELRPAKYITRDHAQRLAEVARQNGVRLIPELDCLGHQSWKNSVNALLRVYPQFAEPSPSSPDPKTDYLKSWCPQNPQVNLIVFDLIDEIGTAFGADAFHVGIDEVFNIASDRCPRCKGGDPAKLFAKAVNDLHEHIVVEKKWEMFIWGDRLLDAQKMGYSKWESSRNGTFGAIDMIPKDIVICDWHYGKRQDYPSVRLFLEKGFRVWPAGFQPLEATQQFSDFAQRLREKNPRVLGYLCTTWSKAKANTVAEWPPVREILKDWTASQRALP